MRRPTRLALAALSLCLTAAAPEPGEPVAAVVETTLTTASRQIRQFAYDGDAATYFASAGDPDGADHFTLIFDRPVALKSVSVVTGRPDGTDALDAGVLEASADGKAFEEVAKFSGGEARAEGGGREVMAVRVRPGGELTHPLVVREFAVDSDPPVAPFRYPFEMAVDVSDAPEMKGWAETVARLCERWYPRINEALRSDGFTPPRYLTMTLSNRYKGVAEVGGDRITGSVRYFKAHPDDAGAMIHETVHAVQHYRHRGNPGWLVEGVADYVRFFLFEPGKIGPIDPRRARYDASYRTTAAFLAYVTETYDRQAVARLNAAMREGRYKDDLFKELTGKTVKELDEEWRATLKR